MFTTQAEIFGVGAGVITGIAAIAPSFGPYGAVLAVAAGILFVLSKILTNSDSPELIEIRNQFRALNSRLDVLSQRIETLFFQLRTDLADSQLDAMSNVLARISTSYSDYVEASTLESTEENGLSQIDLIAIQGNFLLD